jgi:hypothetical protein
MRPHRLGGIEPAGKDWLDLRSFEKYLLYLNSYTAQSTVSIEQYVSLGAPKLFMHWVQARLKAALCTF